LVLVTIGSSNVSECSVENMKSLPRSRTAANASEGRVPGSPSE
jgi:hypothetical protein